MATATATVHGNEKLDFERLAPLAMFLGLVTMLVWAYWPTLLATAEFWENPKYSHGYLIPLFTLVLLYLRRDERAPVLPSVRMTGIVVGAVSIAVLVALALAKIKLIQSLGIPGAVVALLEGGAVVGAVAGALLFVQQPMTLQEVAAWERWLGAALLAGGIGLRLVFTYMDKLTPEMYTFPVCLLGAVLLAGGRRWLIWAGPAVGFLFFMFPLPGPVDAALLAPLQGMASKASTYCLQTMGFSAFNEANVVYLDAVQLNVVEACSGLRMLTIFSALAVAIALVTDRPLWEKVVIVLSSIPIALLVNIIRIILTALCHKFFGSEVADGFFHGPAGMLMVPMALGFLYAEFQILSHLVIDESTAGPVQIGLARPGRVEQSPPKRPPQRPAAEPGA